MSGRTTRNKRKNIDTFRSTRKYTSKGSRQSSGLCGRERKTWDAAHNDAWLGESDDAGDAYFCVHELEKVGDMERTNGETAPGCHLFFMVDPKIISEIPLLWSTNKQMYRFLWIRNGTFVCGLKIFSWLTRYNLSLSKVSIRSVIIL